MKCGLSVDELERLGYFIVADHPKMKKKACSSSKAKKKGKRKRALSTSGGVKPDADGDEQQDDEEDEDEEADGEEDVDDEDDEDEDCKGYGDCHICLDAIETGAIVVRLTCGHVFHKQCIHTWLKIRRSCPMCRCSL